MFNEAAVSSGLLGASGILSGNAACAAGSANDCDVTHSRITEWGGGFVQEIDAAAMSLWIQAERFDAHADGCTFGVTDSGGCVSGGVATSDLAHSSLQGMTVVKFGGLINF